MAGLPLAGAMMGLALGGPVGLLAGVKLGGVAAVGGSFLGYTGACVIKEQKEMRSYIDEHYKAEPELCITPRQEARLHRRQPSVRSETARPPPLRRAHSSSEQPSRQLPSLPSVRRSGQRACNSSSSSSNSPVAHRRKWESSKQHSSSSSNSPVCNRRKWESSKQHSSSSSNSPVCPRRKWESSRQTSHRQPRPAQPPHLQPGQFRRLGDLSEEEQRSVLALIASQAGRQGGAEARRKQFARQHERERRAASLPDVLEESS